ncbi:MAG: YggS family pyridoxal phosphate-dependent enzyme [Glaciecola sp.]
MASNSTDIAEQLTKIQQQITLAAKEANRAPNDIQLLAVSKTKPVSDIITAYNSGQRHFGENYVQEAVDKITELSHLSDICWHFIGPLQSNKSKFVAEHFAWMHSLDRIKIAKRLNEQRSVHQALLQVCVQVNIDDESSKAGIAPEEVLDFVGELQKMERLTCRGLMTIPKAGVTPEQRAQSFNKMQDLLGECATKFDNIDTLSMGMSDDMKIAIQYGATMVRVGTGIFGKRG